MCGNIFIIRPERFKIFAKTQIDADRHIDGKISGGTDSLKQYTSANPPQTTRKFVSGSTVKPVLSGHSKIDKTKIIMTKGNLMKVESIAECSPWNILQYF